MRNSQALLEGVAGVVEGLNKATVGAFLEVLKSKLTQYDRKVSAKERMPNIYRLGHLLGAAEKVQQRVKASLNLDTPEALQALNDAMDKEFERGFPPVNAVKKQIEKYLATGKMPSLV